MFRQVTDFANVFKAFIGTNWIGLPFAFKQSGIVVRINLCLWVVEARDLKYLWMTQLYESFKNVVTLSVP